jgi:outer membrane protein OmpA-like peptidoglycan-associated protein
VNYLIARGINSSRLVVKGYGEERLINRCADGVTCTEKEHERNRRTEFRVLSSY